MHRSTTTLPCDVTGNRGIRPDDTEESAKVLYTVGGVGDVDTETGSADEKTGKDEWPAQPQPIRKVGKQQQNNCYERNSQMDRKYPDRNSLAATYGGTVRRFETATEYPNPRMIEGRKNAIP